MNCKRVSNKYSNFVPAFCANAKIIEKSYHKINDTVIKKAVNNSINNFSLDSADAISGAIGKSTELLASAYGAKFKDVCECFNDIKTDIFSRLVMPIQAKRDPNVFNKLYDSLTSVLNWSKMADSEGSLINLPYKVLKIEPGNGHIDDNVFADIFINNGVNGIKSVVGDDIHIFNVKDYDTSVKAFSNVFIKDSTLKRISCEGFADLSNINTSEKIVAKSGLTGHSISAPAIISTRGGIDLTGNNYIGLVDARDAINVNGKIRSEYISSKEFDIIIDPQGTLPTEVATIFAPLGVFRIKNPLLNENFIGSAIANEIEVFNVKGGDFNAMTALSIFGENNIVKNLYCDNNIEVENIFANSIVSKNGSITTEGKNNKVDKINAALWAKLKNLSANEIKCAFFENNGNVRANLLVATGKFPTNL